jgi:hypothetical protein
MQAANRRHAPRRDRSAAGHLRRLVGAHKAAAARLAAGELRLRRARAEAVVRIARHLEELREEIESWCVVGAWSGQGGDQAGSVCRGHDSEWRRWSATPAPHGSVLL